MTSTIFVDALALSSKKGHTLCFALQQEHNLNGTKIVMMTDDGKINAESYAQTIKADGYTFLNGCIHHNLFRCSASSEHFWDNVKKMFNTDNAKVITMSERAARVAKNNIDDVVLICRNNPMEQAIQQLDICQPA